MDYFKKIERSVTISADKRSTVDLQVDVWSQDLNVTKFVLKLDTTDSTAIDLTSAAVRVAMVYSQDGKDVKIEAAGIVEDVTTQKIAYIMDDKLAGFEGTVIAGFYVTLSTGQRIDIQNVTFNMCKSLLDKDLDAATESYYQTFDDIAKDVRNQADTQKVAMNNIVKDVQSTGNTAKTQINKVLPDVQSKVSAINTELAKIDENMPDLFVAYADNINGGGFSKSDNTKLYKGYGVKNSTSPTDYRWERNVEDLSVGGENLIINGGFPTDTHGWGKRNNVNANFSVGTNQNYFNGKRDIFVLSNKNADKQAYAQADTNYFDIKSGELYTLTLNASMDDFCTGFMIYILYRNKGYPQDFQTFVSLFDGNITQTPTTQTVRFKALNYEEACIRIYNNGSKNTAEYSHVYFNEVMLVEGNVAKKYQPSSADLMLNSNPVNSILTTLSAENPSTTLGGTWTQLGTESKFSQTIYYWKRTQ